MTASTMLVFQLKGTPGHVDGTEFTDADLANIPTDTTLLQLECSQITDKGMLNLPDLPNLRCIDLDSTSITNLSMDKVATFLSLEEIWIEDTSITDEGLIKLSPLNKLRYISAEYTDISDAAVQKLRTKIPGLVIS